MSKDIKEKSFLERKKDFDRFYLGIVIICGALCMGAIAVAIHIRVLWGVFAAIAAVVSYRLALDDTMKRMLGLSYRRVQGGVGVSPVRISKNTDTERREIPARLLWLDVVELCRDAKHEDKSVCEIVLPLSIQRISDDAFEGLESLTSVVYEGSLEDWANVVCDADLSGITVKCADGEIAPAEPKEETAQTPKED